MVVKQERFRYMLINFFGLPKPENELLKDIRKAVQKIGGDLLLAKAAISLQYYSEENCIIKCTHITRNYLEAAIELITSNEFKTKVIKVSGTLKSIQDYLDIK